MMFDTAIEKKILAELHNLGFQLAKLEPDKFFDVKPALVEEISYPKLNTPYTDNSLILEVGLIHPFDPAKADIAYLHGMRLVFDRQNCEMEKRDKVYFLKKEQRLPCREALIHAIERNIHASLVHNRVKRSYEHAAPSHSQSLR